MIFSEHGGVSGSVGVGGRFEVDTQSRDSGHSSGGLSYETGGGNQVWTLTQFFLCFLCVKIIDLPGGQINDPSLGKHYSLPFLPATPSSPSRTLEGLFELTRRPSQALASPRAVLPELQRYKDTVRCAALGAEVPGHRQEQLTQTLIVHLMKNLDSPSRFDDGARKGRGPGRLGRQPSDVRCQGRIA